MKSLCRKIWNGASCSFWQKTSVALSSLPLSHHVPDITISVHIWLFIFLFVIHFTTLISSVQVSSLIQFFALWCFADMQTADTSIINTEVFSFMGTISKMYYIRAIIVATRIIILTDNSGQSVVLLMVPLLSDFLCQQGFGEDEMSADCETKCNKA
jgi:hypothetical protein